MFQACADPKSLEGLSWLFCYLTSAKHVDFYWSFLTVLLLLAITAPAALGMGFMGATAARSHLAPVSWLGKIYIWMVRGVPDIIFFLFFVIALDQGIEYAKSLVVCDGGITQTVIADVDGERGGVDQFKKLGVIITKGVIQNFADEGVGGGANEVVDEVGQVNDIKPIFVEHISQKIIGG